MKGTKAVHTVTTHHPGCLNDYQAVFPNRETAREDFRAMVDDWLENEHNARCVHYSETKAHDTAYVEYGDHGATVIVQRDTVPWTELGTDTYSEVFEIDW
jgi:hypothetical protein